MGRKNETKIIKILKKTSKCLYDLQQFETIRSSGDSFILVKLT